MSGTLELAAGIFAVIGVADVALRTGRDVYGFLHKIADTPNEIEKLCVIIRDITLLAEASKELLEGTSGLKPSDTTRRIVSTLEVSLKSFNREIQSLKVLSARFRDTNKNWSRIRFVLDERKINKALDNLERSKSLLGNALMLACKQESDDRHRELLQRHDSHEEILSSTRYNQVRLLTRQANLARTSTSIHREATHISKTLTITQQENISEHQKTREVLSTRFQDIVSTELGRFRTPLSPCSPNRDVYFLGERRDMIMAYLLLVKPQLEIITGCILSRSRPEISTPHVFWLQSEFDNLVASAAQQEAVRHPQSTATPLDRWHYSEDVGTRRKRPKSIKEYNASDSDAQQSEKEGFAQFPRIKPPSNTQQIFSHDSAFGSLCVHVPQPAFKPVYRRPSDDVGFTFTCGIGQSVHAINARFLRDMSGPKICAQLNVFTLAKSETHYNTLFASASAMEIDAALRQGVISPYHINREGQNLCLYYAAEHTRTDLLDYLDSQGIGISSLNHDVSVVAGLFKRSIQDANRSDFETSVDHMLTKVSDTTSFLFETTMNMLLWDYYKQRPRSLLTQQLQRLQRDGLLPLLDDDTLLCSRNDNPWDQETVSVLVRPLFESGAQIDTTGSLGRNRIQRAYCVVMGVAPGDATAVEEIANILIQAGVKIHHRDYDGLTPSMYARRCACWKGWCRALERNGFVVEEVLREEGSEWLAEEGWREVWEGKFGALV